VTYGKNHPNGDHGQRLLRRGYFARRSVTRLSSRRLSRVNATFRAPETRELSRTRAGFVRYWTSGTTVSFIGYKYNDDDRSGGGGGGGGSVTSPDWTRHDMASECIFWSSHHVLDVRLFVRVWTPIESEGREGRTAGGRGRREKERSEDTREDVSLVLAISRATRTSSIHRTRVCVRCLLAPDGHERWLMRCRARPALLSLSLSLSSTPIYSDDR